MQHYLVPCLALYLEFSITYIFAFLTLQSFDQSGNDCRGAFTTPYLVLRWNITLHHSHTILNSSIGYENWGTRMRVICGVDEGTAILIL